MASENGGYRGLLVDYGGVLTSNLFDSFRSFCELEGLEPEEVGRRFRKDPACRELLIGLETGKLPEERFEEQLGQNLGVPGVGLIDRLFVGSGPEPTMVEAVRRARGSGIRTGLVSNSWGTRRYDRARLHELFDGIVISGDVGIRKPARGIYELGAQRVALPPSACVFVDDLSFNLTPAAELGMATVHHVDPARTIDELERLLEVQLR
ncbi:MAG: HAD family hydrolase [Solirubrobacteraceae bacterium]